LAFFGYMDWMIMYKWVTPVEGSPPGLIDTMITMGLSGGGVRAELYDGQETVQKFLFKIGLFSVPLMLIPKPLILWAKHAWSSNDRGYVIRRTRAGTDDVNDRVGLIESTGGGTSKLHAEEFDFGEIAIHQAIETIEFVLGTVSHTASYLRLWALSLAHQQLSIVFLQKTLYASMSSGIVILNAIPIYIGFAVYIGVTIGILLGMDVMECFLHTLRLHWVEFQSKFYKADGVVFKPFQHKTAIEEVFADPSATS
jgi:V-type H+-transporting ATPase subunit a